MSKNRYSSRGKRIGKLIALFLAGVLLCTVLSVGIVSLSNSDKNVNSDNLIDVTADDYIRSQNTARGVEIDVKDDGVIKLSGKATSAHSVKVATVTLKPGTYTLSGVPDPEINKMGLRATYGDGIVCNAGTESATFTLTQEEMVTITLYWAEDYSFGWLNPNSTIKPVLVEGDKVGEFYA